MLNWKDFEGSGRDLREIPILEFAYKYNKNQWKTKVIIAEDLAEIWTMHLLNTNLVLPLHEPAQSHPCNTNSKTIIWKLVFKASNWWSIKCVPHTIKRLILSSVCLFLKLHVQLNGCRMRQKKEGSSTVFYNTTFTFRVGIKFINNLSCVRAALLSPQIKLLVCFQK